MEPPVPDHRAIRWRLRPDVRAAEARVRAAEERIDDCAQRRPS